jgi:hypothetical protein
MMNLLVPPQCLQSAKCSEYSEALVLDTSHLCVMARLAHRLANAAAEAELFAGLLEIHRCYGRHRLITSREVFSIELNLSDPDCPIRQFAELPPDALDALEKIDGDPSGTLFSLTIGDRDRTLLAAAVEAAQEGMAMLLTDDEQLFTEGLDLLTAGTEAESAVLPRHSIDFFGSLYECRAISFAVLASSAEAEEEYLETRRTQISAKRHRDKLERIRTRLNQAAILEARRANE